jgi:hypothetical protein
VPFSGFVVRFMIRDDRDSGKLGLDEAAIEEMVSPRLYDYYT